MSMIHEPVLTPAHTRANWLPLRQFRGQPFVLVFFRAGSVASRHVVTELLTWKAHATFGLAFVHGPEYDFEQDASMVDALFKDARVPFVHDHDGAIRRHLRQHWSPSALLVDASGRLHDSYGHKDLCALSEALSRLVSVQEKRPVTLSVRDAPEEQVYSLGLQSLSRHERAGVHVGEVRIFAGQGVAHGVAELSGPWSLQRNSLASHGGSMTIPYTGTDLYLAAGGTGSLVVTEDGQPLTRSVAGDSVHLAPHAHIPIQSHGLYHVATHAEPRTHTVTITASPGTVLHQLSIVETLTA